MGADGHPDPKQDQRAGADLERHRPGRAGDLEQIVLDRLQRQRDAEHEKAERPDHRRGDVLDPADVGNVNAGRPQHERKRQRPERRVEQHDRQARAPLCVHLSPPEQPPDHHRERRHRHPEGELVVDDRLGEPAVAERELGERIADEAGVADGAPERERTALVPLLRDQARVEMAHSDE